MATPTSATHIRYGTRTQTAAWVILITSFLLFCTLCTAGTLGVYWFFFESLTDMDVRITVSRGRTDLTSLAGSMAAGNPQSELALNTTLAVDSSSQSYLTFRDTYSGQPIAAVYALQDSTITFNEGSRPRFEWSRKPYSIRLSNAAGRFVVYVPPRSGRTLAISLQSPLGEARFSQSGRYMVNVTEQGMELTTYEGVGELRAPNGKANGVPANQLAILAKDQKGQPEITLRPYTTTMLNAGLGGSDVETNSALPIGWVCTSFANKQNEPQGVFRRELDEQRVTLHMSRSGPNLDHAETSCDHPFGEADTGLDITNYTWLSVRAEMRINAQDVTTCGVQGSECPIMLELKYVNDAIRDANGNLIPQFWRHGFYADRPFNDGNPLTCDTCLQDHEKITLKSWYIYDSGNLLTLLPQGRRPQKIVQLRIYSSGHAYDIDLAEIAVLAGKP